MKRIILQLMSELSILTPPFNPVDIKKIFAKHPSFDATQVPPELKEHAKQLLALNDLTKQSFDLANQRHNLSAEQEHLIHLTEENSLTQQNIYKLQEQMRESTELVGNSFQQLMPLINENLLKKNKLSPPYSITVDSKTQKMAVEEYNSQLSKNLNEIDARAATLTFFQLTKAMNSLIEELKILGVTLSAKAGNDAIQKLIASIARSASQLSDMKPKAIELQQFFAKQISVIDVQAKIEELKLQTATIEDQLYTIAIEISVNILDPIIKRRLSEEFQQSPNKSELIKTYQDKVSSAFSYINLYAWKSWAQDPRQFDEEQKEVHNSVNYLQLLEKEYLLKLEKTRLDEQKKKLDSLEPIAQSSSDSQLEINKLVGQAQVLLKECALITTPIAIFPGSSASDFYLALLSYIPHIEQKLEQMTAVLLKLQKLDSLGAEILLLRTRYKLEESSFLPANQKELEELIQLIEHQKPAKEILMQQLEMGKSFLQNTIKLEEIKRQLQETIIHKKDIESKLAIANHGVPIADQLHVLSGQLSVLCHEIASSIEEINRLPLPYEKPEELQDSSFEVTPQIIAYLINQEQLTPLAPVSLNLDMPPIPSQDSFIEQSFTVAQTVSIPQQPLSSQNVDHKQSTSTVLIGLKQDQSIFHPDEALLQTLMSSEQETLTSNLSFQSRVDDGQSISPAALDVNLKSEQLLLNIPISSDEILAEHIFSASLPMEEPSGEQSRVIVQSLKPQQPSRDRGESLADQSVTSEEIIAVAEPPLVTVKTQDEQLIVPISVGLSSEPSSVHTQEQIGEQLPIPDKMLPLSIQAPLAATVADEQFVLTPLVSLKLEQPTMFLQDNITEPLISADTLTLDPKQLLSTNEVHEPPSLTVVSISLNPEHLSPPVSSIEVEQLTSDEVVSSSNQPLLTEKVPNQQLASAQEKTISELTSSNKVVPTIKQLFSADEVCDELLPSLIPVDLKSAQPLMITPDRPVEQLTIAEQIISTSTQTLITGEAPPEKQPTISTGAIPDQSSTHAQAKPIKELLSSDKITLGLQQPLSSEKAHAEQLISIAPVNLKPELPSTSSKDGFVASSQETQKKLAEPLKSTDDRALPLAISSSAMLNESQKRQNWYQESLILLKHHPIEIQQWYMNVYKAIEIYSNGDSYKPSHLMRDILFELQFKRDLDVINGYMRLCPDPEKDLNKLLALKSALPLVDEPFDEVADLQDAPVELKPLYTQYIKLKKSHPIEGELLLQAIHSLRVAKIFIDTPHSNISVTQVPSLSKDPRYEPLKRHRGFFKVWEAIEDFCRMLIGKLMGQAEFEYTRRPCFFRTRSAQLVDEADLMIQKDLLPICAT